jgi:large subunit ribosomal protein L6
MSRVGLNPVSVPEGVSITIAEGEITAKGKLGELSYGFIKDVNVTMEDGLIKIMPKNESKRTLTMWGTTRSQIFNLVKGVNEGFSVTLEINGVGYRAAMEGKNLVLQLGYSHNVVFPIPDGVTIKCAKPMEIIVSGADKQQVGQVAANIRSFRKPEPYKGKGIKYADEYIMRKEGKKK